MTLLNQIVKTTWNTLKVGTALALIVPHLARAEPTLDEVKEHTRISFVGNAFKIGTYDGISYDLQGKSDLMSTNWQYLCSFQGAVGTNCTSVPVPEREEKAFFYRVVAYVPDDGFIEEE